MLNEDGGSRYALRAKRRSYVESSVESDSDSEASDIREDTQVVKLSNNAFVDEKDRIPDETESEDEHSENSFDKDGDTVSEDDYSDDETNAMDLDTPTKSNQRSSPTVTPTKRKVATKVTPLRTPKRRIKTKGAKVTPLPKRSTPKKSPGTPYAQARERLHVSAVPNTLPCREDEFAEIAGHLEAAIEEGTGTCIYISGVPGTGKTATVHEVIRYLQEKAEDDEMEAFDFVEINGMKVTDPTQAYSLLWEALFEEKVTSSHALTLLEKHFSTPSTKRKAYVVLMDELDVLVTKKQTVMYNFFNWPNLAHSRLIVVAVANTMDLPERMLTNKVSSRLGLTRINFQPYTHQQLRRIVQSRLEGIKAFEADAVELASRKVGAVSGDARRALDICRRAVEIVELGQKQNSADGEDGMTLVSTRAINQAIREMFSSSSVMFVRSASLHQKLFLAVLVAVLKKTGTGEATFGQVTRLHLQHCQLSGIRPLTNEDLISVCASLGMSRAILVEQNGKLIDSSQRLRLSAVSEQDINVALRDDKFFSNLL